MTTTLSLDVFCCCDHFICRVGTSGCPVCIFLCPCFGSASNVYSIQDWCTVSCTSLHDGVLAGMFLNIVTAPACSWWKNDRGILWSLYDCRMDMWWWRKIVHTRFRELCFLSSATPQPSRERSLFVKPPLCAVQTWTSVRISPLLCVSWTDDNVQCLSMCREVGAKVWVVSLCLVFDVAHVRPLLLLRSEMHLYSWLCWCTFEIKVFHIALMLCRHYSMQWREPWQRCLGELYVRQLNQHENGLA